MDYGYNQDPYSEMEYYQRQQALARQQQPNPLQSLGNMAANKLKDKAVSYGIDKIGGMFGGGASSSLPAGAEALGSGQYAMNGLIYDGATGQAVASQLPAAAGFFDTGGILGGGEMSLGQYAPGVAGAFGMADVLMNKRHGARGAAQGALSGAGMGFTLGGPVGAGIGAVAGGALGYFGNLGDEDKWKTEQDRADKLREQGINWDIPSERLTKGRSKEELVRGAQANIDAGRYGNVKFAQSRNESDLNPEDIWGYSTFGEKYGDKWLKGMSEEQRRGISQALLNAGAVNEHHGTIDVDWNKLDPKLLASLESGDKSNPEVAALLSSRGAPGSQPQAGAQLGSAYPEGMWGPGQPQNAPLMLDPGFSLQNFVPYTGGGGLNAMTAQRESIAKSLLGRHKARMASK